MDQMDDILKNAPRLGRQDGFEFACHAGLPCFNGCCRDLTIELTPADLLNLRSALGMSAGRFIKEHTLIHFEHSRGLPAAFLKMKDDAERTCPFVTGAGCSVYDQRPVACRMYPVGRARLAGEGERAAEEFFFLLEEDPCVGYGEKRRWTVQEWLDDQGVAERDRQDEGFLRICQHPRLREMRSRGQGLSPMQLNEYFMALYNQDRFIEYLESKNDPNWKVLSDADRKELAEDSHELLKFAATWVEQSMFGASPRNPDGASGCPDRENS